MAYSHAFENCMNDAYYMERITHVQARHSTQISRK